MNEVSRLRQDFVGCAFLRLDWQKPNQLPLLFLLKTWLVRGSMWYPPFFLTFSWLIWQKTNTNFDFKQRKKAANNPTRGARTRSHLWCLLEKRPERFIDVSKWLLFLFLQINWSTEWPTVSAPAVQTEAGCSVVTIPSLIVRSWLREWDLRAFKAAAQGTDVWGIFTKINWDTRKDETGKRQCSQRLLSLHIRSFNRGLISYCAHSLPRGIRIEYLWSLHFLLAKDI